MNLSPTIATFQALTKKDVMSAAMYITNMLRGNGARAYFVGGCVRDAILGNFINDIDIEVFGMDLVSIENTISQRFEVEETGKSFCVLKLKNFSIDVSVPRSEERTGNTHRSFSTKPLKNCTVMEAASRRDFTVNAIYFDVQNEKLADEFGGIRDLQYGILRHVSEKFSEDPLRVLRGMQFAGRFRLKCDPETAKICNALEIGKLSKERIFAEWEKLILKAKSPSFGLKFLRESGWIRYFPEIMSLCDCHQDVSQHPEDTVFEHTCLSMDVFAKTAVGKRDEDIVVGLATLCHDFGKPATTTVDKHGIHHYGHDEAGVVPTKEYLEYINTPQNIICDVLPLVQYHMRPRDIFQERGVNDERNILHLANDVGRIDRLLRVCYNDFAGRGKSLSSKRSDCEEADVWLKKMSKKLGVFDKKPTPIIQGRDLVALGMQPSEKFSKMIDECFRAQLDGAFKDHNEGVKYLQTYLCGKYID